MELIIIGEMSYILDKTIAILYIFEYIPLLYINNKLWNT